MLGPLGTLHLSSVQTTSNSRTDRGIWLESSPLGDVIVAQTTADCHRVGSRDGEGDDERGGKDHESDGD